MNVTVWKFLINILQFLALFKFIRIFSFLSVWRWFHILNSNLIQKNLEWYLFYLFSSLISFLANFVEPCSVEFVLITKEFMFYVSTVVLILNLAQNESGCPMVPAPSPKNFFIYSNFLFRKRAQLVGLVESIVIVCSSC